MTRECRAIQGDGQGLVLRKTHCVEELFLLGRVLAFNTWNVCIEEVLVGVEVCVELLGRALGVLGIVYDHPGLEVLSNRVPYGPLAFFLDPLVLIGVER